MLAPPPIVSSEVLTVRITTFAKATVVRQSFSDGRNQTLRTAMSIVALSELLGATVRDASGAAKGRVREIAVTPQDHPTRVAFLIVRTANGERTLPAQAVKSCGATVRATSDASAWEPYSASDGVGSLGGRYLSTSRSYRHS